jgi:hypothetical protein
LEGRHCPDLGSPGADWDGGRRDKPRCRNTRLVAPVDARSDKPRSIENIAVRTAKYSAPPVRKLQRQSSTIYLFDEATSCHFSNGMGKIQKMKRDGNFSRDIIFYMLYDIFVLISPS